MAAYNINSTFKLNSGYEIPQLGFGVGGVYRTPPAETATACLEAFSNGYRHIDSAIGYYNEAGVGEAMRSSKLPRSEIFFTSKIPRGTTYENTKAEIESSLQKTGLDYIDLMLIHSPFGGSTARKECWRALVDAVEEGKIRSIGISNYGIHHLDELEKHIAELEAEYGKGKGGVISVGQWEVHPWCPRDNIVEWCAKRNIVVEAYAPVVRGQRFGDRTLKGLAEKYSRTQAQILLRWSLQKGYVPLPKSVTPSRIKENAEIYDFEISQEDMPKLDFVEYMPVCWDPTIVALDK